MNSNHHHTSNQEPIAIIGIGCRFPGGVKNTETFWQLLCNEVDAIGTVPANRYDVEALLDDKAQTPGKIIANEGGFIDDIDQFDASFFGISPREANYIDPQQRLLLEVAWEALEDGGQVPTDLLGSQTGVFIGMWTNDYEDRMYQSINDIDLYVTTGGGRYSASGRLSYTFDFRGPSMTVDTACSSSLVSVHLACHSLWSGESAMAVAGGVNLILEPPITIGYSRSRMLSPDARCKFGDARANGYVRSEGAGLIVLKTLSQAQADGDPIYAVIRGSAVNNDGRSSGLLVAPGVDTQIEMLREAYRSAGVNPGDVTYVEAHGTGTGVGDPVEIQALGTVLGENRADNTPCVIGSVKTNIGHTEAASGIAGLIKAVLALKNQAIPASLHFETPNPKIPWDDLPIHIQTSLQQWPDESAPALAGVNSFGVTGTNAHIVLQEAPEIQPSGNRVQTRNAHLIPFSAHSANALQAVLENSVAFFEGTDANSIKLDDVGFETAVKKAHHTHRLSVVAHDIDSLTEKLKAHLNGEARPGMTFGHQNEAQQNKIVFVFSGQGSHWLGMGRELLETEPVFRDMIERCDEALRPFSDWSLLKQLTAEPDSPVYRLDKTNVMQPTLVSIEIALAELWQSFGVTPDAVIGHSLGEVAAAYVAGALSLPEAMQVICSRSQLMARTSGQGAMVAVELSIEETEAALAGFEDRLTVAVSNSPTSTVISGDPTAIAEIVTKLEAQNVLCRKVNVDIAFHSQQMDPLKDELFEMLTDLSPIPAATPTYSTSLGKLMDAETLHDATYWVKNLRQPVLFSKMVQLLLADEHTYFIEMSPHSILSPAIHQGMKHAGTHGVVVPSMRRNKPGQETFLAAVGTLYASGIAINWQKMYPTRPFHVKLPSYPWQRERFWIEPAKQAKMPVLQTRPGKHPLLGHYLQSAAGAHIWEAVLSIEQFPYLADHRVAETAVFPAAAYLDMTLSAVQEVWGKGPHAIEDTSFTQMLTLPENGAQIIQLIITPENPGTAKFQFFSRPVVDEGEQEWIAHAAGTIRIAQDDAAQAYKLHDFPQASELEKKTAVSQTAHYEAMAARGLNYGTGFQGIVASLARQKRSTC